MGETLPSGKVDSEIFTLHYHYQKLYFFELLVCVLYFGCLGFFVQNSLTSYVFFGMTLVCGLAFIATFFVRTPKYSTQLSMVLVAVSIGLVPLQYFISTSLLLLVFFRLVLMPFENLKFWLAIDLVVSVVIGISAYHYLPPVGLSANLQTGLNYLSLVATAVVLGYFLWQIFYELQQARHAVTVSQSRIQTLVSVTNKLSRFVPAQIWQPIIRSNQPLAVTNHRKKLTILFSDIVGFTELSDNLSPAYLADILNTYFERMTTIANEYDATLDKFIGDGMLCFFGDTPHSDDKQNAINCGLMALEMRDAMCELRSQWQLLGFAGLYIRIGINTGECHVGNFGSRERVSYTLIGKAANLASRLESVAQKDQILLSESTFSLVKEQLTCNLVGEYQLKGLSQPIPVWELLAKPTP